MVVCHKPALGFGAWLVPGSVVRVFWGLAGKC